MKRTIDNRLCASYLLVNLLAICNKETAITTDLLNQDTRGNVDIKFNKNR